MMRAMFFDPRRALLAGLLVAVASAAHADLRSLRLEELTSTELAEAIGHGYTTILVPIGGTEQNGDHIALGKHNRRAEALADRIAAALGHALVAPVIAYVPEGAIDPPAAHMRFPGTITIPSDVFVRTLESAAQSLRRHGFRDIVFLGDHGGYRNEVKAATERLNRAWSATPIRAHAPAEYYASADEGFRRLLERRGFSGAEIGTHAGLADTSLTLALAPALVRTDRLRGVHHPGVSGDPARASAEIGQAGVELVVGRTADVIRNALSRR
jgi:creatinine amidohydrolase/Fe(II)-dependent formamide hydrolase-like protein